MKTEEEQNNEIQQGLFNSFKPIEVKAKPRSKYQRWKLKNNYRKADNGMRCANCKYILGTRFYKCKLLGLSCSSATDIRLSNVCDLFTQKDADCQLCKYLDCDTKGHFICSKDGEILDHEGIYCDDMRRL